MALSARNDISHEGIFTEEAGVPFEVDGTTLYYDKDALNGIGKATGTGTAVTLSGNKIVRLCADGEFVLGQIVSIDSDNIGTVAVKGLLAFGKGNGATVTRGHPVVGAVGASSEKGFIRNAAAADGSEAEMALGNGRIWDVADAAAVEVFFG